VLYYLGKAAFRTCVCVCLYIIIALMITKFGFML